MAAAEARGDRSGKRLLYSLTLGNHAVASDVRAAFERALGRLRELGAELVELDETPPDMEPIWKVINHATWRPRLDHLMRRGAHPLSSFLVAQVRLCAVRPGC